MTHRSFIPITLDVAGGSLEGYVVDALEPNIGNYLSKHTAEAPRVVAALRERQDRVALLRHVWVDENQRGTGIGTSLLSEFLARAEAEAATAILLICDVFEDQRPEFNLRDWYESFGFEPAAATSSGPLMAMPEELSQSLLSTGVGPHAGLGPGASDTLFVIA